MDIHHEYMCGSGLKLHVVSAGDGPPVILLHGFPEFWYSWRHQIPALAASGYRVLTPDLRGYNLSDRPAQFSQYHLQYLVDDIAEIIRASGGRAHVVGHDWGGIVAWTVAGCYPELVDKLSILNAPHIGIYYKKAFRPPQVFRSTYVALFCLPYIPELLLSANSYAAIKDMFTRLPKQKGAFTPEDIDAYIEALSRPGALTAALNYYRCGLISKHGMQLARKAQVDSQTLIIWGEQDPALGVELLDGIERFAPNSVVHRLPQAGHWVQNEAPDEVNRLLIRFFDGIKT